MNAHELDGNGLILNTIVVESLDFSPGLVDADQIGGCKGDSIIDGVLVKTPPAGPSFEDQKADYLNEVRALREKLLIRLNGYGTQLLISEPPEYAEEKALCAVIVKGLLDITTIPAVLATTDMDSLKIAVKIEYARLVSLASEDMVKAFRQVDL